MRRRRSLIPPLDTPQGRLLRRNTNRANAAAKLVAGIRNPLMRPYLEGIVHGSHEGLREAALNALGKIEIAEHRFSQAVGDTNEHGDAELIDFDGSGLYVLPKD